MNLKSPVIIKRCIFIGIVLLFILFACYIMLRYNVEGEKQMPFNIEKILVVSTVAGKSMETENPTQWKVNVNQNNDVYLYIQKDDNKNGVLKNITIENFQISKKSSKGKNVIYRPTGELANLYDKSEQNYINDKIVYEGSTIDNLKTLEISNQGGILGFRISNEELGTFTSGEEEEIQFDSSLLTKIGLKLEDVKFSAAFDIIIETEDNVKYKSTINMDLPADGLIEKGRAELKITDFSNVVFKRVK